MLHLENFFEKSFALLLTTPRLLKIIKNRMTAAAFGAILNTVSRVSISHKICPNC